MRITIVGGGNIGTQFAVHCAAKGHSVILYTSQPELYDGHLNIVDDRGVTILQADIKLATYDAEKAFGRAELILVTLPAMLMEGIAETVYHYSDSSAIIGVVPGNGGSECAFRKCIERGNIFFGIERVPAIARLVQKGKTVQCIGYRDELHVASLPRIYAKQCTELISGLFDKHCTIIPNYLNLTMTPSNPILHTTRLRTLFANWHNGIVYDSLPLFYEAWDDASSKLLFACDEEVQTICRALPEFHLTYVKSLKEHYESQTIEAMTKKITSIQAFKGLQTPMQKVAGGLIPDLHSRYFTADFSYGLEIIKQIADFANVAVPNICETLSWYENISVEKSKFNYSHCNIMNTKDFKNFYSL